MSELAKPTNERPGFHSTEDMARRYSFGSAEGGPSGTEGWTEGTMSGPKVHLSGPKAHEGVPKVHEEVPKVRPKVQVEG